MNKERFFILEPLDLFGRQRVIRQYCYCNQLDYFDLFRKIW